MAEVIKATEPYIQDDRLSIFLGGSIDMGTAEDWQARLTKDLSIYNDLVLLNPRRDDWDASWEQDPTPGTQFHEQVAWELDCQEQADVNIYYFTEDSKAPITLLELGLFNDDNVVVRCPKEFYRYGNVKMVCDRYGLTIVETYDELLQILREALDEEGIQ